MSDVVDALVLLPGLDGTGRLFWRLERELQGRVKLDVVAYPSDPRYGYRELVEMIRARIGARTVVVLGESFSGPIAVELAATMPGQVKGLIMVATFLRSPLPAWLVKLAGGVDLRRMPRGPLDAILRGGTRDPKLAGMMSDIIATMPPGVRASRLRTVSKANALAAFERVQCPILALHGRGDWLVPRRPLETAIRGKQRAVMKLLNGPHMLLQNNPKAAAREIEAFLAKIGRSP